MSDLEFAGELVEAAGLGDGLMEVRVKTKTGKQARAFVATSGRVGAVLTKEGVYLQRALGSIGQMRLTWPALKSLAAVCAHWGRRRNQWALFTYSSSGFPPGLGGGARVQAPGAKSKWQLIGGSVMRHCWGRFLKGREARAGAASSLPDREHHCGTVASGRTGDAA